ncbi:DUF4059 family protein [Streptococcus ovis]|uniref:DUF4059 family protein n=1 Tax=Streptococcus ovis TaxID=82806 RepID=UPI000378A882|nr:DUF4059 family protein [Streptococcus ovis]
MLQTILSLYLQGLVIATLLVIFLSACWFMMRVVKGLDKTVRERREALYDVLMMNVMTIPIVSFGIVGILLILKAW